MSRAKDIFDSINTKGEKAIDEYIRTRKTEGIFLDFKRSLNIGNDTYM